MHLHNLLTSSSLEYEGAFISSEREYLRLKQKDRQLSSQTQGNTLQKMKALQTEMNVGSGRPNGIHTSFELSHSSTCCSM